MVSLLSHNLLLLLYAVAVLPYSLAHPQSQFRSTSQPTTAHGSNIARITIKYNEKDTANDNHDTNVVVLHVPSSGSLVRRDLGGINIASASLQVVPNTAQEKTERQQQNLHVTCFFWRASNNGVTVDASNNFISYSFSSTEPVMRQKYSRANRVYCYDSTADQGLDSDSANKVDIVNENSAKGDRNKNEMTENSELDANAASDARTGIFTLLFEYRKGVQSLIKVRSPASTLTADLDFSGVKHDFSSSISSINTSPSYSSSSSSSSYSPFSVLQDLEIGINVVRVALVAVPRRARQDSLSGRDEDGVEKDSKERLPSCFLWLSRMAVQEVREDLVAQFSPYLNVYGVTCFRAAQADGEISWWLWKRQQEPRI